MATYGQSSRNRPALYKPTDFGSHQKRSNSSSSSETKKEEEKVTFKIQQRPQSEEKPIKMEQAVKAVNVTPEIKEVVNKPDEKPGGVAQKDIDRITKLKEFMAKQEKDDLPKTGFQTKSKESGAATSKSSSTGTKDQSTSPVKTTVQSKSSTNCKVGGSSVKSSSSAASSPGLVSTKPNSPASNKEQDVSKDEKSSKGKDKRDLKDNKHKGSCSTGGGSSARPYSGRNANKNVSKQNPPRNKQNQNEKQAACKPNRSNDPSQSSKSNKPTSANNGGTRPKIISSKASGNSSNNRLSNDSHKNNRSFDRQNQMNVNSYYSQANKMSGFPNNEPPPWLTLPYSMNGMHLSNQSILGQPQGPRLDFNQKSLPSQDKNPEQNKGVPGSISTNSQKKVVTVAASKDKSEQKKSLDFVKSFFDNDPEVQYNRKLNAETKNSAIKQPVVSTPSVTPKDDPQVNRLLLNNHNQVNSHTNSHMNAHLNSHINGHANSHIHSPLNNQVNNRITSHGNVHVNSQSFVHPSSHIQAGQIPGSHIPGSMATTYSSVYHQSNMSNMAPNSLHPNPQSAHFQGSSGAAAVHMGATPNQMHGAISHPSSLQHGQQYDLYSQVNQMNPLLSAASSYHGAVSNYPATMSHNSGNVNPGFQSYSGYFPDANHMSHVHHIQQQLDPDVMTDILQQGQTKGASKNWQEKALTKCGPIDSNQARSLIEQLIDGTYECMVCCDSVKWNNQVWSCSNCHHVFHLTCIRKWARSETAAVKDESGWRCPGCQNVSTRPPNKYYCFCGKVRDPDWNPRDGITPHSCGEVCIKKRTNPPCEHSCNELCHPGPCPSCPVMIAKHCPCGKTIAKSRCGQVNSFKCENTCLKLLNCGKHHCQMKCHKGPCTPCEVKHSEECFCGQEKHYVVCGTDEVIPDEVPGPKEKCQKKFTCNQPCGKKLACQSHDCGDLCHPDDCKTCPLLPENVNFCPCGKVLVSSLLPEGETRTLCLDPIPTCESFCGKKLLCGPKGLSHLCMMKCHTGRCLPCQKVTTVQCRCGATKKEIACKDLNPAEDILCERKCNKKRKCGRHKCNQKCCLDRDHACNIVCGKKLSCGMHKCEEVCHTGFCPTCWRAGFDELSCNCGATVLYPPIACGSKPPDCDQPCTRKHLCGHPPTHTCHSDNACPPCTLLINKQCMGGHEIWKNVPCHLSDVSCGRSCGKVLRCGFHKCIKTCHKGACLDEGEACVQACPVKRKDCSHPCGARCHAGMMECLTTPCKAQITIRCRCGRKSANAFCLAGSVSSAYESFNSEILTSQLRNLQSGQSIDLASLTSAEKKPKFLDCDEECSRLERNKRLAEALGIENPESRHFHAINFSSFLKQEAKAQFPFIQMLEEVLENLVQNAKKSTQSQIQHSLPPMNVTQRKIVHELSEAYGCKTYSLDPEPKRNTVVVATKESYVPGTTLSTIAEREMMSPVPPQPVMLCKDGQNYMVLGPQVKPFLKKKQTSEKSRVDYFDDNYKDE